MILISVLSFIGWAFWGPEPALSYGLISAVGVQSIACPCAIGLATPISIMSVAGRGARAGVLIKNAEALERFEKVDTLIFDKTSTPTEGKPRLVAVLRGAEVCGVEMAKAADFEGCCHINLPEFPTTVFARTQLG